MYLSNSLADSLFLKAIQSNLPTPRAFHHLKTRITPCKVFPGLNVLHSFHSPHRILFWDPGTLSPTIVQGAYRSQSTVTQDKPQPHMYFAHLENNRIAIHILILISMLVSIHPDIKFNTHLPSFLCVSGCSVLVGMASVYAWECRYTLSLRWASVILCPVRTKGNWVFWTWVQDLANIPVQCHSMTLRSPHILVKIVSSWFCHPTFPRRKMMERWKSFWQRVSKE